MAGNLPALPMPLVHLEDSGVLKGLKTSNRTFTTIFQRDWRIYNGQ